MVLVGHVIPKLSIALLIGIRVLCDAGCKVVFTKTNCNVWYKGKIILSGTKDPSTDLWTLPINAGDAQNLQKRNSTVSQKQKTEQYSSTKLDANLIGRKYTTVPPDAHDGSPQVASFTHSFKSRANAVKFAHQSLCNQKILALLKAVRRGFLNGCPNLSEKLINKYLNAIPATAKGHMKRP
jgi:hypothetical protein